VVDIYHPYLAVFGCSHKTTVLVYEDTSAQRGYHSVWRLARGHKHRKRSYSGPSQCVPAENNRRKKGTIRRGQARQRKDRNSS
jgi:hypothetical protein